MRKFCITTLLLAVLFVIAGLWLMANAGWSARVTDRKHLGGGIHYCQVDYVHLPTKESIEVCVVVVDGADRDFGIVMQPANDVSEASSFETLARSAGASLLINGGYFDTGFQPVGLVVKAGVEEQPLSERAPLSGVVCVDLYGRLSIVPRQGYAGQVNVNQAIQAGPFLIDPGGVRGIHSDDLKRAKRSAIGITIDGQMVFMTTSPCTLYEFCQVLYSEHDEIGVRGFERVLNLDGGPSSGLYFKAEPGLTRLPESAVQNGIFLK